MISTGFSNFDIFKRYPQRYWPSWVYAQSDSDSSAETEISPPVLLNTSQRQWSVFSNFISSGELRVDPSGMITPSFSKWSIEFWLYDGKTVRRPQFKTDSVSVVKDTETLTQTITWSGRGFEAVIKISGSGYYQDMALISAAVKVSDSSHYLAVSLRPYNNEILGTLNSAGCDDGASTLSADGIAALRFSDRPHSVFFGTAETGDIDLSQETDSVRCECPYGLASVTALFKLKKGQNELLMRAPLVKGISLSASFSDTDGEMDKFRLYSSARTQSGISCKLPDARLEEFLLAMKSSLLEFLPVDAVDSLKECSFGFYTVIHAMVRAGYFEESERLINDTASGIQLPKKKAAKKDIIDYSHLVSACSEYFIYRRDSNMYRLISGESRQLLRYSKQYLREGSLGFFLPGEVLDGFFTIHEAASVLCAVKHIAYMARCGGLFGEEREFSKEAVRLENIISSMLSAADYSAKHGATGMYIPALMLVYPYSCNVLSVEEQKSLIKNVLSAFDRVPVRLQALGVDVFSTALILNSFLSVKKKIAGPLKEMMAIAGTGFTFPDYVNPVSMKGVWGDGADKVISAMMFILTRNLLFSDTSDQLEIFPEPDEAWFKTGNELRVDNAPSRFGEIGFRIVTTSNEIQLHFSSPPRFIPPDIQINLPFKTAIVEGDDYILKKESSNSYIINGWPSVVRFLKR